MVTPEQRDLILHTLLQIDDPYYLNQFQDASSEDEWFHINEQFIQQDLQRFFPSTIDTHDPETWQIIRAQLKQF
ncbi:hypothetical protein [Levilactobacillus zymae]|uniref:Uncharacterized protein n=1 Tax=Levilactobacillus zymae TaxID=267363 RepID=A0ABQ0WUM9_9LACO|nr:hypothetical protein [Levilactobacillus zymae]KRL11158.1 hypothetical protein FD38_GL001669 [Levilactobacillus zymae DSM 19395]QFR60056.1 hypothetical protein LZ395_00220 [Levilactobacillus zymae]GEO71509.1 hypothetical protein LZY01_06770 [Levilactobacillus zymae]